MKTALEDIPTPCYVVDEAALEKNLRVLDSVQRRTGCKIIMALKGFAMFSVFPLIREYLHGVTASSLDEAQLGFREFGGEVHVFAPAYRESEFDELLGYTHHLVFNSFSQWNRYKGWVARSGRNIACGMRVNPEHSEVSVPLYDPCGPFSRLGVTRANFEADNLQGLSGLHFHTLCELNADSLARTLPVFEEKFGEFLQGMQWVNFGGGHHITRQDYDVDLLCRLIDDFKRRYPVEVYLEPGEAIALNTGVLVASVLDIVHNGMDIAILDTSAAAHMPDVLEMPYRPEIDGAGKPGDYPYTYRLGGMTCLAGDIIGDYSFSEPLSVGSRIVLLDMAHYTMVKNNTFNGVRLPSIAIRDRSGAVRVIRQFGYEDYRNRLS
ncbi:carboxynorspermidine decarboxylase [Desulforhabdus sp. TSK]|uniref:carboxynorspermidine decarboxylase n=1 Tax=Desulforhabdus sp. TSK TaxID=2925014 RepID=UPI001FC82766|nr:carboxynorspermidine decarboxylase [Desulforhabdus sp. TSK]GKT08105.1 carboxynorspermidine decarboxylase [Desulforhabdus sp. TSK]